MTLSSEDKAERFNVVFHKVEPSDAIVTRAAQLFAKLFRKFPSVMYGTMTIEGRHHHHHNGNLYHVALRIHLPGGDVVVSHDPEQNHAHEDLYVAMRDACEAARRQLMHVAARNQGQALRHEHSRFEGNPRHSSLWDSE